MTGAAIGALQQVVTLWSVGSIPIRHPMKQERIQKERHSDAQVETEVAEPATTDSKEALKHELDDVLDEIDAVLEENAEEFIKGYVQKGGE